MSRKQVREKSFTWLASLSCSSLLKGSQGKSLGQLIVPHPQPRTGRNYCRDGACYQRPSNLSPLPRDWCWQHWAGSSYVNQFKEDNPPDVDLNRLTFSLATQTGLLFSQMPKKRCLKSHNASAFSSEVGKTRNTIYQSIYFFIYSSKGSAWELNMYWNVHFPIIIQSTSKKIKVNITMVHKQDTG